jgi:hypothetical protein
MAEREIEIEDRWQCDGSAQICADLRNAIDLASGQDQMTWLTSCGKRIAAIVPVCCAGYVERHPREDLHGKTGVPSPSGRRSRTGGRTGEARAGR